MKVSCPACDSKYTIADEKVTGRKVKVRCKSCGGQIVVDGTVPMADPSANASATEADENDATRVFTSAERSAFDDHHAGVPVSESVLPSPDESASSDSSSELIWSVNVSENDERSLTTEQLVSAYLAGELDGEVYVWHDGLADWSAIPNVPELTQAIAEARVKAGSKPASAKPEPKSAPAASRPVAEKTPAPALAQAKKTLPTAAKGSFGTAAKAAVGKEVTTEKKTAARASTAKRPQSAHDIFAAASQASEDVDVSVSQDDEQKKTGARNESSVLFSLDALKAGIVSSPQPTAAKAAPGRKAAPVAPKKKLEDLMSTAAPSPLAMGGPTAGPLGMSTTQALLMAPAPPPPPKPEPKPVVPSDVPPAAGAVAASPSYAEPPKKKKNKLLPLVAVLGVVALGGVVFAMMAGKGTDTTVASASAVPPLPKPESTPEPIKPAEPAPADTAPTEAVASASAAPSTSPVAVAANNGTKGPAPTGPGVKATDPKKDTAKKEEKKPAEPAGPVSSGLASFNKGAAIQALSVAASQATICKKPDGPTGTGKVTVTFAPSGRATTAIVSGGSFGGTTVGGCISNVFKRAKVPAFDGDPVTVSKSFTITL